MYFYFRLQRKEIFLVILIEFILFIKASWAIAIDWGLSLPPTISMVPRKSILQLINIICRECMVSHNCAASWVMLFFNANISWLSQGYVHFFSSGCQRHQTTLYIHSVLPSIQTILPSDFFYPYCELYPLMKLSNFQRTFRLSTWAS